VASSLERVKVSGGMALRQRRLALLEPFFPGYLGDGLQAM
jgi:hypothetical protein